MIDVHPADENAEIEALLRAAGEYVRPSPDFRPRVLASMNEVSREREDGRVMAIILVLALLAAILVMPVFNRWDLASSSNENLAGLTEGSLANSSGDANWLVVDSFVQRRQRHGELLGFCLNDDTKKNN